MLLAVSSCRCGESIVFLFITHYSLFITHLHNDFSRLWSMNGYVNDYLFLLYFAIYNTMTGYISVRGRAKITSHFPAGSFGHGLRCSLLTDPRAGYARRSRLAGGQNSRAVKYEFIFARPLKRGRRYRAGIACRESVFLQWRRRLCFGHPGDFHPVRILPAHGRRW